MKVLNFILIVLFSVSVMSCGSSGGDETDDQKPGIVINSPKTGTPEVAGQPLNVSASLTDNVELKSYVLTIKNTGTKATTKTVDKNWGFDSRTTDQTMPKISGVNATLTVAIPIPDNVEPNDYKLELSVTDASGNSDSKSVTFGIQ